MMHRGGGQIIPTARRVSYSAFLLVSQKDNNFKWGLFWYRQINHIFSPNCLPQI